MFHFQDTRVSKHSDFFLSWLDSSLQSCSKLTVGIQTAVSKCKQTFLLSSVLGSYFIHASVFHIGSVHKPVEHSNPNFVFIFGFCKTLESWFYSINSKMSIVRNCHVFFVFNSCYVACFESEDFVIHFYRFDYILEK